MPGPIMSAAEYTDTLDVVTGLVRSLLLIPADRMLTTLARIETVAPILDPTAYRNGGMINLDDQRRLIQAVDQLREVAIEIREREGVSP